MPVISVNVKKIEASKQEAVLGPVTVGQAPKIKDMKPLKLEKAERDGLEFDYEFLFDYKKDSKKVASITISGNLLFVEDAKGDAKEALEKWKKNKKIPVKIFVPVLNSIIRRSCSKAITLAEDLNMPPPVRLPQVKVEKKEDLNADASRYIG